MEGETPESSLQVEAALIVRAVVVSSRAFINIFAGAFVGRQGESLRRTGTLVAARHVHTPEGTETPDALRTLVYIFTGVSVVLQVVTLATVALIRSVDVGALLAARFLVTFVYIFTVLAVQSQGEALRAGAVERAGGVFTRLSTQSAGETPALIYIGAEFPQRVVLIPRLTVTGVAARKIVTNLTESTAVCPHLTLVKVDTRGSIRAGAVPRAAGDGLLLAGEGSHRVDAVKTRAAQLSEAEALIDVDTVSMGVL